MKFSIIQTGGKQYKVSSGQKLKIEKLDVETDGKVVFDKVLLVADGDSVKIGTPYVEGAKVEAKVLKQGERKRKSYSNTILKPVTAKRKATGKPLQKWK